MDITSIIIIIALSWLLIVCVIAMLLMGSNRDYDCACTHDQELPVSEDCD